MRNLQISQAFQVVDNFTEVRKYVKTITAALVVCFICLPLLVIVVKNSNLHFFEPFQSGPKQKSLEENVHNHSDKLLVGNRENFTQYHLGGQLNNSSPPPIPSTVPKTDQQNSTDSLRGGQSNSSSTPPITSTRPETDQQNSTDDLRGGQLNNSSTPPNSSIRPEIDQHNSTDDLRGGQSKNSSTPPITSTKPRNDHQKSTDDLFARGFSKESCRSRYEYSSYQKNKLSYKPSPYLLEKLRSYEELHARCGPKSSSYQKTINKLTRSHRINNSETLPCKYLVWTAANGLGNRMISIASAFLFSLLENRVLIVDFEAEMDGLFCEPFPNSTWLLPKNFPHRNNWGRLPNFRDSVNSREDEFSPPFLHLNLQHGDGDENLHHFHCNNKTLSLLEKIPALILITDQYFVPSLFMIPSLEKELSRMFPRKDTVFHHLSHYLYSPSNEAWGLITRFYQAYLANADQRIGIQLRVFNYHKGITQDILSQILSCTQTENILPSFFDTAKGHQNLPLLNSTSKSKAVLVASLYPEYAENLRRLYWTRPTVNGDVVGVYQPSHEEQQKTGDNMHNMKALAEIYLLSLCDVILTSPQSTFGYVAQSLGGLKPWIMVRLGSNYKLNPACERGFSMEPCFHIAPQYDCKDKRKIDNYTTLYPHLKNCDDVWWGAKLFD